MNTAPRDVLVKFLDGLLSINAIPSDASNNGLQIEGADKVSKIIFGVDACMGLFRYAERVKAQFVFVHHGLSWGDELKRIQGINANRLSILFKNGMSVYAAHLPLDCHPQISHNVLIADSLKLNEKSVFAKYAGADIGVRGILPVPVTASEISKQLNRTLKTKSKIYGDSKREIRKVAIIAGSAGTNSIIESARQKIDCFITGEINHTAYHVIEECGVTVISAGHYATETPGVIAVMKKVSENFGLKCEFLSIPTGM